MSIGKRRVNEMIKICTAKANLVAHDEFSDCLLPFLKSSYDALTLAPTTGVPMGFDQTQKWIEIVCKPLAVDAVPALADMDRARQRANAVLSRLYALTGLPRGCHLRLAAECTVVVDRNWLGVTASLWLLERILDSLLEI